MRPPASAISGFGERSDAVSRESGVVENYVSDGPYQANEYPAINLFVPPWGLRERTDSTYFPIPWLLSTGGYGVLAENPETSYFRLRSDAEDAWSVEVTRAPEGEPGGGLASAPRPVGADLLRGAGSRGRV